MRDRAAAEAALIDHDADIALIFEPVRLSEMQEVAAARQPIHALMQADHPPAFRPVIRLRDCAEDPIGLPLEGLTGATVSRPVDARDVPGGQLSVCQLRGRALPVAAAKFALQMGRELGQRYL